MMNKILCLGLLAMLVLSISTRAEEKKKDTTKKEAVAVKAAETWLKLVDEDKYGESWKEAAPYFKNAVKEDQWKQLLNSFRKPLGKCLERKVKLTLYKTSLPGAPDGEYVVIQFNTSFENKKKAVETVTPMLDKKDQWRVSGYQIR